MIGSKAQKNSANLCHNGHACKLAATFKNYTEEFSSCMTAHNDYEKGGAAPSLFIVVGLPYTRGKIDHENQLKYAVNNRHEEGKDVR